MGCVTSKKRHGEDGVLSLCKERKCLMKLVLKRRDSLAEAHSKYNQSLYALAFAIRLFIARYSSPSSPFLITFPSPSSETTPPNLIPSPMYSQQVSLNTSKGKQEIPHEKEQDSTDDTGEQDEEDSDEEEGLLCEHFYDDVGVQSQSPRGNSEWDFFNPFNAVRSKEEEDLRVVREREGIPELEEDVDTKHVNVKRGEVGQEVCETEALKTENGDKLKQWEHINLGVQDTAKEEKGLLEALKDIEDHFIRAYDSGLDVCRMLETNKFQSKSSVYNFKERSYKLTRSITWKRSSSLQSRRSLLTSTSRSSSTWTEFSNDLFDESRGMKSGSHILTLTRLYAWEKKLYEEVKAGEQAQKIYERKFSHLKKQYSQRDNLLYTEKSRDEAVDSYTKILVTIQSAESISKRIQQLRDEELLPQLLELQEGLMRSCKIMLESHETQYQIMQQVRFFNCPAHGKFCNDLHHLATLQLEVKLQNWCACFSAYFSAQRMYVEALDGWLSKLMAPEIEMYSWGRCSILPSSINWPLVLVMTHDWLAYLEKMPDKAVANSIKSLAKDVQAVWIQQGVELQQKRKVDRLAKELDQRVLAFEREEKRFLGFKLSAEEAGMWSQIEYLSKRKDLLDVFRKKLDAEKEQHQFSMQETEKITVIAFQTGFCSVFESLADFLKVSVKMYSTLVSFGEKAHIAGTNG